MPNVLFETLWHSFSDGWSIASRAYARAMDQAGVGVQLHSWLGMMEGPSQGVLDEVGHLLAPVERDLFIFSCTFNGEWGISYSLDPLTKARRPRAFFTMFERRQVEDKAVAFLNQLEGVWVPSSWNAEIFRAAGVRGVVQIPMPYFDDDPHLTLPPASPEPRTFLWIGRWEPRKAPHNLIRAFLTAFRPGEAKLILKPGPVPWRGYYPQPEELIKEFVRDLPRWSESQALEDVEVVRGLLSPGQVLELYARADVYASASRGEGLDLPSFFAKVARRRVVTTDSGGPRDFLGAGDWLVHAEREVPADPLYRWGSHATYADYSLDELVAALQGARSSSVRPSRIGPEFHSSVVGQRLREWVEGVCAGCPTEEKPAPRFPGFADWALKGED